MHAHRHPFTTIKLFIHLLIYLSLIFTMAERQGRGRPGISEEQKLAKKKERDRRYRARKKAEKSSQVQQEFAHNQAQANQAAETPPRYNTRSQSKQSTLSPAPSIPLPLYPASPQVKEPSPSLQPSIAIASSSSSGVVRRYNARQAAKCEHEAHIHSLNSTLQQFTFRSPIKATKPARQVLSQSPTRQRPRPCVARQASSPTRSTQHSNGSIISNSSNSNGPSFGGNDWYGDGNSNSDIDLYGVSDREDSGHTSKEAIFPPLGLPLPQARPSTPQPQPQPQPQAQAQAQAQEEEEILHRIANESIAYYTSQESEESGDNSNSGSQFLNQQIQAYQRSFQEGFQLKCNCTAHAYYSTPPEELNATAFHTKATSLHIGDAAALDTEARTSAKEINPGYWQQQIGPASKLPISLKATERKLQEEYSISIDRFWDVDSFWLGATSLAAIRPHIPFSLSLLPPYMRSLSGDQVIQPHGIILGRARHTFLGSFPSQNNGLTISVFLFFPEANLSFLDEKYSGKKRFTLSYKRRATLIDKAILPAIHRHVPICYTQEIPPTFDILKAKSQCNQEQLGAQESTGEISGQYHLRFTLPGKYLQQVWDDMQERCNSLQVTTSTNTTTYYYRNPRLLFQTHDTKNTLVGETVNAALRQFSSSVLGSLDLAHIDFQSSWLDIGFRDAATGKRQATSAGKEKENTTRTNTQPDAHPEPNKEKENSPSSEGSSGDGGITLLWKGTCLEHYHATMQNLSTNIRLQPSTFRSYGLRDSTTYTSKVAGNPRQTKPRNHAGNPLCQKVGVVRAKGYNSYKDLFGSMYSNYRSFSNAELPLLALPENIIAEAFSHAHGQHSATTQNAPQRRKLEKAWQSNRDHIHALCDERAGDQSYTARKEITFRLDIIAILFSQGDFSHHNHSPGFPLGSKAQQQEQEQVRAATGNHHAPYWILPTRGINAFVFTNSCRYITLLDDIFQLGSAANDNSNPGSLAHQIARYYTATLLLRLLQLTLSSEVDMAYDNWIWRESWDAFVYGQGQDSRTRVGTVTRRGLGLMGRLQRDSWLWLDDEQMDWMNQHLSFKALNTCFIPRSPQHRTWLSQCTMQSFTSHSIQNRFLIQELARSAAAMRRTMAQTQLALGSAEPTVSQAEQQATRQRQAMETEHRAILLVAHEVARSYALHLLSKLKVYWDIAFKDLDSRLTAEQKDRLLHITTNPTLFCASEVATGEEAPPEEHALVPFIKYAQEGPPTLALLIKRFTDEAEPPSLLPLDIATIYREACAIYFELEEASTSRHSPEPSRGPATMDPRPPRDQEIGLQGLFPQWISLRGGRSHSWLDHVHTVLFANLDTKSWKANTFCTLYQTLRDGYTAYCASDATPFDAKFAQVIGLYILVTFNTDRTKEVGTKRHKERGTLSAAQATHQVHDPVNSLAFYTRLRHPRVDNRDIAMHSMPTFFNINFWALALWQDHGHTRASPPEQHEQCFTHYDHFGTLQEVRYWQRALREGLAHSEDPPSSQANLVHELRHHAEQIEALLAKDQDCVGPMGEYDDNLVPESEPWRRRVGHYDLVLNVQQQSTSRESHVQNAWPSMFLPYKEVVMTMCNHVQAIREYLRTRANIEPILRDQPHNEARRIIREINALCNRLGLLTHRAGRRASEGQFYLTGSLRAMCTELGIYNTNPNSSREEDDMMAFLGMQKPPQSEVTPLATRRRYRRPRAAREEVDSEVDSESARSSNEGNGSASEDNWYDSNDGVSEGQGHVHEGNGSAGEGDWEF